MKREFRLDLCEPVDRCGGGAAPAATLRIGPRSAVSVQFHYFFLDASCPRRRRYKL